MSIPQLLQRATVQKVILFLFAFGLYSGTLSNGYVLDDKTVITENAFTKRGIDGIEAILLHDSFQGFLNNKKTSITGGQYHPLSLVTFALEYEYLGNDPYYSHLINVLLYSLSCVILLAMLRRMFAHRIPQPYDALLAFLAALLFTAHPIHTEVVAHVKNRDMIFATLFAFSVGYMLIYGAASSRVIKGVLLVPILLCFGLALVSHEAAMMFLIAYPFMLYYFTGLQKREMVLLFTPFIITLSMYMYVRSFFALEADPEVLKSILYNPFAYSQSPIQTLSTIIFVLGKYLLLMIFPHPLTHDYSFNQITLKNWYEIPVLLSAFAYLVGLVFSILTIKHKNIFGFGIIFYLVTISFASHLVIPGDKIMRETLLYAPVLGYCIALVYAFYLLALRLSANLLYNKDYIELKISAVVLLITTFFCIKTIYRNAEWKDDYTLFSADVKNSPNSAQLRDLLADAMITMAKKERIDLIQKRQWLNEAIKHLDMAVSIYPEYLTAWVSLGDAYAALGRFEDANKDYRKALSINPTYPEAHQSMGKVCLMKGEPREAIKCFKNWIRADAKNPRTLAEAFLGIGIAYEKLHRLDSAIIAFYTVTGIDSTYSEAYNRLGVVTGKKKGSMHVAISYFNRAVHFDKYNAGAYQNLGEANFRKGDYLNALRNLSIAIKLEPDNALVYMDFARIYEHLGDETNAEKNYQKAFTLDPNLRKLKEQLDKEKLTLKAEEEILEEQKIIEEEKKDKEKQGVQSVSKKLNKNK